MNAFDLVALDMAGTTINENEIVYKMLEETAAAAIGHPVPADVMAAWKGTAKDEALVGILRAVGSDVSPDRVAAVYGDFHDRLVAAYVATPPTPIDGVPEALAQLRSKGVKVALQTGYDVEVANLILDAVGWKVGREIDVLVTSDLVAASRPAPYMIFRAMEATGVQDVRRVLTAGDTPNDLGAGWNAGAGFVVGVTTGAFSAEQLGAYPHSHILGSTAELPMLV
ncbi:phosphonoacetaldehyde hydrolase [Nocardioides baekrokdamisoli]|uniref:Phosphonoacetaldehyde hydrolase n=1 Tax=Nocardioides baekrokdamisoli TaxID=1804624 RepID=A0A3G9IDR0_9ACTN|nr:phosphonatase-like hydrolase [Nocardioides baekrokdamisoli]BBH16486.1 phosphonoacetaldehyde hydrolase [Nocardioides baekrokdamisoli]